MRKFNENEKKIIEKIIAFQDGNPISFIDFLKEQYFIDYDKPALILDNSLKKAIFFIKRDKNRNKELSEFYEIIFLCSYLKENRYLNHISAKTIPKFQFINKKFNISAYSTIDDDQKLNNNGDYYRRSTAKIFVEHIIFEKIELDIEIYHFIINDLNGILFISEELKDYVNNKFRTQEEKNFNTSKVISITGIVVAIGLGVFSFFSPNTELKEINKELNKIHYDIHPANKKTS